MVDGLKVGGYELFGVVHVFNTYGFDERVFRIRRYIIHETDDM